MTADSPTLLLTFFAHGQRTWRAQKNDARAVAGRDALAPSGA